MATAITANDSTARIPAWKRLGLKLKWANDSTTSLDDNGRSLVCINEKGDKDGDPPSSKRRKVEESMEVNESVRTDLNTSSTKGEDVLESEECDAMMTYESEDGSEPKKTEAEMEEKEQRKERKKEKKKEKKEKAKKKAEKKVDDVSQYDGRWSTRIPAARASHSFISIDIS